MVVAENNHGKTYLLDMVVEKTDAIKLSGCDDLQTVNNSISGTNSIILIDEAGAFPHPFELVNGMEENPDTQVIVSTLPDCPSMEIIKSKFAVVHGRSSPNAG